MNKLTDPRYIKSIMQKHGVRFSKGLGQNFIADPHICPEIARLGGANESVGALEIGPGIGVLTAQLAAACNRVAAIEVDATLLPVLNETLAEFSNINIIHADVLKLDLTELIERQFQGMEVIICANLPYYITSPILMHLLESKLPVKSITVMVQKEAAQRICAPMPSRQSGAITAAVHYHSAPTLLMDVPRTAFLPPPNVDSAVIRLDVHKTPPVSVPDERVFFNVVKAAFSQRRKTLLNTLSASLHMDKAKLSAILQAANIPPTTRAEQLSMENFAELARILTK